MLFSALVLGFMGSLHCIGMCGPIAFMLPLSHDKPAKKIGQLFLYHLGRIFSYAIMGVLFGFLGKELYVFGLQQKLTIGIGILMILAIIIPQRFLKTVRITQPLYRVIGKLKQKLGKELKKKTPDTFLTIGVLNGFLPCGLVYMAIFGAIGMASTGLGVLFMVLFGVGTIPLMTTVIYYSNFLKQGIKQRIRKLIPAFVVLIGVLFIIRGLGLGIPYVSPAPVKTVGITTLDCAPE